MVNLFFSNENFFASVDVLIHIHSLRNLNLFENSVSPKVPISPNGGWDGISCEACQAGAPILIELLKSGKTGKSNIF